MIKAQAASPTFTHVYAGLVAIMNTKFPQTGELIAKRLLVRFRKGFRRNDKVRIDRWIDSLINERERERVVHSFPPPPLQDMCNAAVKFVAHLVNQQVLHELVALELLTLLLEDPTDDSVEVAIGFLKVGGEGGEEEEGGGRGRMEGGGGGWKGGRGGWRGERKGGLVAQLAATFQ